MTGCVCKCERCREEIGNDSRYEQRKVIFQRSCMDSFGSGLFIGIGGTIAIVGEFLNDLAHNIVVECGGRCGDADDLARVASSNDVMIMIGVVLVVIGIAMGICAIIRGD